MIKHKYHKILFIVAAVIAVTLPLWFNLLYVPHKLLMSVYDPGDLLSYYGAIIIGGGTFFLGYAAWIQSERNYIEEKLEKNKVELRFFEGSKLEIYEEENCNTMTVKLFGNSFFDLNFKLRIFIDGKLICDQKCIYQLMGGIDNTHHIRLSGFKYEEDILSTVDKFILIMINIKAVNNNVVTDSFIGLQSKLAKEGDKIVCNPILFDCYSGPPKIIK